MQNATLHVKIKPEFASSLRKMASVRGASVGELVRQALISTYQADMLGVSRSQRQALEADAILDRMIKAGFYSPANSISGLC